MYSKLKIIRFGILQSEYFNNKWDKVDGGKVLNNTSTWRDLVRIFENSGDLFHSKKA